MPQKRGVWWGANKKSPKARGRFVRDEFIDVTPGLTPQTNPPPGTQILKGTVEGKKCDTAEEGTGDGANGEKVGGKAGNVENLVEWKGRDRLSCAKALDGARATIGNDNGGNGGVRCKGGEDRGITSHVGRGSGVDYPRRR